MADAVIRKAAGRGWTTVYNSVAQDTRLTLKARGLYLLMWSLPDDWTYTAGGLATIAGCGRDAIRGGLRELEAAGYLTREQTHDGGGKFGGTQYLLQQEAGAEPLTDFPASEIPSPLTGNPSTEKPATENPTVTNKEYNKRNKDNPPLTPQGDEPELFARFWALYPKKRKKRDALRAWKKLDPDMDLCREMSRALKVQMASYDWQKDNGQYIPYPATWLRGRMWEDDYSTPPGFDETPPDDAAGGYYL